MLVRPLQRTRKVLVSLRVMIRPETTTKTIRGQQARAFYQIARTAFNGQLGLHYDLLFTFFFPYYYPTIMKLCYKNL